VVALVGSDAAAAESLVASLEDESKVAQIRGELALVRTLPYKAIRAASSTTSAGSPGGSGCGFISRGTPCC